MVPSSSIVRKTIFFTILFIILGLISCSKKTDETTNKDDADKEEIVSVSQDDFTESDEDLLTVDYKEFYDELAPHGEWIEVTGKEIGVDLKKSTSSLENKHRKITLQELFGIKEAYAYDDVDFGAFFVWRPAPNVSVSVVEGEPAPQYVPYSNGEWVYTDAGWYFKAPTPYEETVHHHGRWVNSPSIGWTWVPGRVWAPAWVDWRENDTYIAWTPVPPGIYIVNNVIVPPQVVEERYMIVEKKHFGGPDMYKYMYKENKNKIMIKEWKRVDGVMVMNKTVINKGPDITGIEKVKGNKIERVSIKKISSKDKVKYSGTEYNVYSPSFKKVKSKGSKKTTVSKPNISVTYENAKRPPGQEKKIESSGDKDKGVGNDKKLMEENEKVKNNGKQKGDDKGKDKNKNETSGNDKSKDKGKKDKTNDPGDGNIKKDKDNTKKK